MSDTNKTFIGQAEFYFCPTVTTKAAADLAGYRRYRDVSASKITNSAKFVEHYSTTRGIRVKDQNYVSEALIGYEFTLDEFNRDAMRTIFMGSDTTNLLQTTESTANGDSLAFNVTPSDPTRWYQICKSGVPIVECTVVTVATLTENVDFELDLRLGLIRFITTQSAARVPVYTCATITSASATYMYGITPLTNVMQAGMGRVVWWNDNNANKKQLDHTGFSCQLSLNAMGSVSSDKFADYSINCVITSLPGVVYTSVV